MMNIYLGIKYWIRQETYNRKIYEETSFVPHPPSRTVAISNLYDSYTDNNISL